MTVDSDESVSRYPSVRIALIVALIASIGSAIAKDIGHPSGKVSNKEWLGEDTDQACFGAIRLIIANDDGSQTTPLRPITLALVKRCNGNPNRATCEAVSRAMMQEFGKTPFTCGSDTADSVPLILPSDPSASQR